MGMTAEYRRMTADEFAQLLEAVRERPYGSLYKGLNDFGDR